jgi:hypothetical protein
MSAGPDELPPAWERLRRLKNTLAGTTYALTRLRAELALDAAEAREWELALEALNRGGHALNALVARRMRDAGPKAQP